MDEEAKAQPLDYRGIDPRLLRVVEDAESRRWRLWRVLFRVGVILLLMPVTFYFGPNLINFGKLTSLTPADFVPIVQNSCVPTVRAMKEYERDTGHPPKQEEDLVPKYLASVPHQQHINDENFMELTFVGMNFTFVGKAPAFITYDFTPGAEGWRVSGPFAHGPIPVPAVTIGPGTGPVVPAK